MKKLKNNKGFTLIELIGVVLILGVLLALVVPRYINFDSNAENVSVRYEQKVEERLNVFKQYGGEENLFIKEDE